MFNLVIFGAPGSGKGTQSEKIISRYGLHHISTGELLRDHISKGSRLGKIADSYISKGLLIPDDLMIEVLADVLDSSENDTSKGVIFDGFPRTIPQAKALKEMLEKRGTKLHAVVGLEVDEDALVDRMLKRAQVSHRADDNPDTIRQRLKVYHTLTSPLKDYYKSEGKYLDIDGNGDMDKIFADIDKALSPIEAQTHTGE